ncbi:MAG: hypothetical protein LBT59_21335 [Clostridiales bacterium]|jgi:hypothetical protein|nr:hypothetical protein [Clostridiales bacterium]
MNDNAINKSVFLLLTAILATLYILIDTPAKADTYWGDYCPGKILSTDNTVTVNFTETSVNAIPEYGFNAELSDGAMFLFHTTEKMYNVLSKKARKGKLIEVDYRIEQSIASYGPEKWCESRFVATAVRSPKKKQADASNGLHNEAISAGMLQGRYEGHDPNPDKEEDSIIITLGDGRPVHFRFKDDSVDTLLGDKAKGKQVMIYYETEVGINDAVFYTSSFFKYGRVLK